MLKRVCWLILARWLAEETQARMASSRHHRSTWVQGLQSNALRWKGLQPAISLHEGRKERRLASRPCACCFHFYSLSKSFLIWLSTVSLSSTLVHNTSFVTNTNLQAHKWENLFSAGPVWEVKGNVLSLLKKQNKKTIRYMVSPPLESCAVLTGPSQRGKAMRWQT